MKYFFIAIILLILAMQSECRGSGGRGMGGLGGRGRAGRFSEDGVSEILTNLM